MGPPALDKSSNTLPLSLAVTYQQKGERPIDDVFTYEIVKVLPPGFDADFLKSSRTKAKIMDHKTRIKGIDVGMGQETNKNIEVLLLPRDQISDIENDRLRFYVFFYASWKDSLNQSGSFDKCFSMAVPKLGVFLNTFTSVQLNSQPDTKTYRCEEPR